MLLSLQRGTSSLKDNEGGVNHLFFHLALWSPYSLGNDQNLDLHTGKRLRALGRANCVLEVHC
jgi:hypothetical protein